MIDENLQQNWQLIYDEQCFSTSYIASLVGCSESTIKKWLSMSSKPKKENYERMIKIMADLRDNHKSKVKLHPSYGWATEDQIQQLKTLGLCPTRDKIIKDIERQTKIRGEVK